MEQSPISGVGGWDSTQGTVEPTQDTSEIFAPIAFNITTDLSQCQHAEVPQDTPLGPVSSIHTKNTEERPEIGPVNNGDAVRFQHDRDIPSADTRCCSGQEDSSFRTNVSGGGDDNFNAIREASVMNFCQETLLRSLSIDPASRPQPEDENEDENVNDERSNGCRRSPDSVVLTDADAEGDTDLEWDYADPSISTPHNDTGLLPQHNHQVSPALRDPGMGDAVLFACTSIANTDGESRRGDDPLSVEVPPVDAYTNVSLPVYDAPCVLKRSTTLMEGERVGHGHTPLSLHYQPTFQNHDGLRGCGKRGEHVASVSVGCNSVEHYEDRIDFSPNEVLGNALLVRSQLIPNAHARTSEHLSDLANFSGNTSAEPIELQSHAPAYEDEISYLREFVTTTPSGDTHSSGSCGRLDDNAGDTTSLNVDDLATPSTTDGVRSSTNSSLNRGCDHGLERVTDGHIALKFGSVYEDPHEHVAAPYRHSDAESCATGNNAYENEVTHESRVRHRRPAVQQEKPATQTEEDVCAERSGIQQRDPLTQVISEGLRYAKEGGSTVAGANIAANAQRGSGWKQVSNGLADAYAGRLSSSTDTTRLTEITSVVSTATSTLTSAVCAQSHTASEQIEQIYGWSHQVVENVLTDDTVRPREHLNTAENVAPSAYAGNLHAQGGCTCEDCCLPQSQIDDETLGQTQAEGPTHRRGHDASLLDVSTRSRPSTIQDLGQMVLPTITDSGVGIMANIYENSTSWQKIAHSLTVGVVHAVSESSIEPLEMYAHAPPRDGFYGAYGVDDGPNHGLDREPTTSSGTNGDIEPAGSSNIGITSDQTSNPTPNPSCIVNSTPLTPRSNVPPPVTPVNNPIRTGAIDPYFISSTPFNGMLTSNVDFGKNSVTTTFPPIDPHWQSVCPVRGNETIYQPCASEVERAISDDPAHIDASSFPQNSQTLGLSKPDMVPPIYSPLPACPPSDSYSLYATSTDTSNGDNQHTLMGPVILSRKHDRQPSTETESTENYEDAGHHPSFRRGPTSHKIPTERFVPETVTFLPPSAHLEHSSPSQSRTSTLSGTPSITPAPQAQVAVAMPGAPTDIADDESEAPVSEKPAKAQRKKNHGCWMCHKSFDRPSTLRKHLLVHTGEKAYVCNICNRRFGVASNLNRHTRRCALRPVNASRAGATPANAVNGVEQAISGETNATRSVASGSKSVINDTDARKTQNGKPNVATSSGSSSKRRTGGGQGNPCENTRPPAEDPTSPNNKPKAKRRRRAPSPSRWVPDTLRSFNLTPNTQPVLVPLPPVSSYFNSNYDYEERDSFSFDDNYYPSSTGEVGVSVNMSGGVGVHASLGGLCSGPYHPNGWKGKLPGPGLVGGDVTNSYLSVMAYTGAGGRGGNGAGMGGRGHGMNGGTRGGTNQAVSPTDSGGQRGQAFVYQFTIVSSQ